MSDTTAAKPDALTSDEQQVKTRRILQDYLESRGWAEATLFSYSCEYGEADYICRNSERDEVVLISLDYTFDLDAEPHTMPTLEIDELDRKTAKCTALSYVAASPRHNRHPRRQGRLARVGRRPGHHPPSRRPVLGLRPLGKEHHYGKPRHHHHQGSRPQPLPALERWPRLSRGLPRLLRPAGLPPTLLRPLRLDRRTPSQHQCKRRTFSPGTRNAAREP